MKEAKQCICMFFAILAILFLLQPNKPVREHLAGKFSRHMFEPDDSLPMPRWALSTFLHYASNPRVLLVIVLYSLNLNCNFDRTPPFLGIVILTGHPLKVLVFWEPISLIWSSKVYLGLKAREFWHRMNRDIIKDCIHREFITDLISSLYKLNIETADLYPNIQCPKSPLQ